MPNVWDIINNLQDCGIPLRARDPSNHLEGPWGAHDYVRLHPDQVQEEDRWELDHWQKLLGYISIAVARTLVPFHEMDNALRVTRALVVATLAMLRQLEKFQMEYGPFAGSQLEVDDPLQGLNRSLQEQRDSTIEDIQDLDLQPREDEEDHDGLSEDDE